MTKYYTILLLLLFSYQTFGQDTNSHVVEDKSTQRIHVSVSKNLISEVSGKEATALGPNQWQCKNDTVVANQEVTSISAEKFLEELTQVATAQMDNIYTPIESLILMETIIQQNKSNKEIAKGYLLALRTCLEITDINGVCALYAEKYIAKVKKEDLSPKMQCDLALAFSLVGDSERTNEHLKFCDSKEKKEGTEKVLALIHYSLQEGIARLASSKDPLKQELFKRLFLVMNDSERAEIAPPLEKLLGKNLNQCEAMRLDMKRLIVHESVVKKILGDPTLLKEWGAKLTSQPSAIVSALQSDAKLSNKLIPLLINNKHPIAREVRSVLSPALIKDIEKIETLDKGLPTTKQEESIPFVRTKLLDKERAEFGLPKIQSATLLSDIQTSLDSPLWTCVNGKVLSPRKQAKIELEKHSQLKSKLAKQNESSAQSRLSAVIARYKKAELNDLETLIELDEIENRYYSTKAAQIAKDLRLAIVPNNLKNAIQGSGAKCFDQLTVMMFDTNPLVKDLCRRILLKFNDNNWEEYMDYLHVKDEHNSEYVKPCDLMHADSSFRSSFLNLNPNNQRYPIEFLNDKIQNIILSSEEYNAALSGDDLKLLLTSHEILVRLKEKSTPLVPLLIKNLQNSNNQTYLQSIETLGRLGKYAAPAISELKHIRNANEDYNFRINAIIALLRINLEINRVDMDEFFKVYRENKNNSTLSFPVISAIGEAAKSNKKLLPILIEALDHQSYSNISANYIGKLGKDAEPALPDLLEIIKKGNKQFLINYSTAILQISNKNAILTLLSLLNNKDERNYSSIAMAFAFYDSNSRLLAVQTLIDNLDSENESIVKSTIEALNQIAYSEKINFEKEESTAKSQKVKNELAKINESRRKAK